MSIADLLVLLLFVVLFVADRCRRGANQEVCTCQELVTQRLHSFAPLCVCMEVRK